MTYSRRGRPPNKRNLIRISTHIPKDHHDLLKEISIDEDLSTGQIIRRAIELYLLSQKDVLNIMGSDLAMASHISETRSKKAMIFNHSEKLVGAYKNNEDVAMEIFEELNPVAFDKTSDNISNL